MRRRVKDYWTFLKENGETEEEVSSAEGESSKTDSAGSGSPVLASTGAKKITTVLDPNSRRSRRRKTKDEIEREKSKDGKDWVADST